jgi:hypothetical protein
VCCDFPDSQRRFCTGRPKHANAGVGLHHCSQRVTMNSPTRASSSVGPGLFTIRVRVPSAQLELLLVRP